jgi:serine/threonine-protein kinase
MGIVHRDIKPSNLFLCDLPSGRRVLKVIDFGVARVLPDAHPSAPSPLSVPTATGAVIGTPRYLSPEGAAGEHVDHRADLYAAALVLYTMLTGRGPFDHLEGPPDLAAKRTEDLEPPSRLARDPLPPELDALLLKALRRDPNERFQDADEFKTALGAVAHALAGPSKPNHPEDEVVTRTAAPPVVAPSRNSGLSAGAKRLAVTSAFLFVTVLAFAIGVGLVRLVQALLMKG